MSCRSPLPIDAEVRAQAAALADCALAVLDRPFPHKLDHLILHADDRALPSELHPVFDGCFDWHSSVHMHWSLLRLRAAVPELPQAAAIAARFDQRLRPAAVARELAYLTAPGRAAFERPYGWAWLLKLQAELERQARHAADAARWAAALRPLAEAIARRLADFVRASGRPVRAGTHANSAFALRLARDHALEVGDDGFVGVLDAAARAWFGEDRAWPARFEPSGTDFLSPGLCEALLMQRVLGADFARWWARFEPPPEDLAAWDRPATVVDRRDAQLVHLDGLNLSRAGCLRDLAAGPGLPEPLRTRFREAAARHRRAAWPQVTGGDFVATHWLLSFALL